MSSLYFMTIICDRNQTRRFLAFYKEHGVSVTFQALGRGTAASEILDSFGLEASALPPEAVCLPDASAAGIKARPGDADQNRYSRNGDRVYCSPQQYRRRPAAAVFDRGKGI